MLHIHIMYKICVKWLFTFSVRLLINTTLLVVIFKFQGSQKLYLDFWLLSGVIALSPQIDPGSSRVCPSPLGHILHKTSTFASSYLLRCLDEKIAGPARGTWHYQWNKWSAQRTYVFWMSLRHSRSVAAPAESAPTSPSVQPLLSPRGAPHSLCSAPSSHSITPAQHSTQLHSCL